MSRSALRMHASDLCASPGGLSFNMPLAPTGGRDLFACNADLRIIASGAPLTASGASGACAGETLAGIGRIKRVAARGRESFPGCKG